MDGYLSKPIRPNELVNVLQQFIGAAELQVGAISCEARV
jgi:CheY-like chemotaxis protein